MKKSVMFSLLSLLLVACSQPGMVQRDTASTLYLPPVGTKIELKQPLTVPGERTRVFLQEGRTTIVTGINQYAPNCNFEVRTLSEQARDIAPETFLVVRVQRITEQVVQVPQPVMLASWDVASLSQGGSLPMITRGVHLWIGSDIQPDVMRMTCRGAFADPSEAYLPSIDQMRAALGNYAAIILP